MKNKLSTSQAWAPLFKKYQTPEEQEVSTMSHRPCRDYTADSERPGYCSECGHSEKAHQEIEATIKMKDRPKVITSNGVSRIAHADSLRLNLEVGFYVLEMNMQGYYLTRANPFELPKKVYGSAHGRAQRIHGFPKCGHIIPVHVFHQGKNHGLSDNRA